MMKKKLISLYYLRKLLFDPSPWQIRSISQVVMLKDKNLLTRSFYAFQLHKNMYSIDIFIVFITLY
jgi:hypothetical protein